MKKKLLSQNNMWITLAALALILVSVNVIASKLRMRADLTEVGRFTLSEATSSYLSGLEDNLQLTFYFSRSTPNIPVAFKNHASLVEDFIRQFQAQSNGMLEVSIVEPKPDTDEELAARRQGVSAIKLPTGEELFLGAAFTVGEREAVVPFFDPRRANFIEYDLLEAIVKVVRGDKGKVGVISSLDVFGSEDLTPMQRQQGDGRWALISELESTFDLEEVEMTSSPDRLQELDALLVIHPKGIPEELLYAIDQFVLSGKPVAFFVDPFARYELSRTSAEELFSQGGQLQISSFSGESSDSQDVSTLLRAYGVGIDPAKLALDLKQPTRINAEGEQIDYPGFISLTKDSFTESHAITSHLTSMVFAESGVLTDQSDQLEGVTWTPLVTTSNATRLAQASRAQFGPRALMQSADSAEAQRTLAAIVQGNFKSAFPSGKPRADDEEKESSEPEKPNQSEGDSEGADNAHLATSAEPGTLLIVADVDLITDDKSVRTVRWGGQLIRQPLNNNLGFAVNAIETLAGFTELLAVRSRGDFSRPFTKLQEIRKQAQDRYQAEEERLSNELQELQKKLNEMQGARIEGNRIMLTAEQQSEIQRFREEEAKIRDKRREVRRMLREDIERLGNRLKLINLSVMPILVSAFGVAFFMRRQRRTNSQRRSEEKEKQS